MNEFIYLPKQFRCAPFLRTNSHLLQHAHILCCSEAPSDAASESPNLKLMVRDMLVPKEARHDSALNIMIAIWTFSPRQARSIYCLLQKKGRKQNFLRQV